MEYNGKYLELIETSKGRETIRFRLRYRTSYYDNLICYSHCKGMSQNIEKGKIKIRGCHEPTKK